MTGLQRLILISLVQGIVCPPTPVPWYDSYGPNQLFVNEGQEIKTVSGAEFLKGVSTYECAQICNWMDRSCQCCNSFTYRPSDKTCYLKKRDPGSSNALKTSSDGWQSYKYWGDVTAWPGPYSKYTGGLPDTVSTAEIRTPIGYPYDFAYISKGPNQIAKVEGNSIKTSQGYDFLTNKSPKQCADECNAATNCDAFSYNPFQNQGTCYMKTNSQNKFQTVYNSDGWTYYWKEQDFYRKCYCTCKTDFICIMCDIDDASCDAI